MNQIDKIWYKALKFLSRLSIDETLELKKRNPKKFQKYVPEEVESTFERFQYITFRNDVVQVVSQSGLQQLRDLEEIKRKDLTLIASIASIVAVIISSIALAKSMGVF